MPAEYATSKVLRRFLRRELYGRFMWWKPGSKIDLPDKEFYIPTTAELEEVYLRYLTWKPPWLDHWPPSWTENIFDCDNFALALWAVMSATNIGVGGLRASWAGGRIHGHLPGPHAMGWSVTRPHDDADAGDWTLWFLEPQMRSLGSAIFLPRPTDKKIWAVEAV